MKKVGVIGAGTMGQGIANAFATNGYDVTVCDLSLIHIQMCIRDSYTTLADTDNFTNWC